MSIIDALVEQHRRAHGAWTLAPAAVARVQMLRGNEIGAMQTLRASYAPTVVSEAWRALRAEQLLAPAGQAAVDAPRITGLSTFGTLLLGGLVVAGLWWAAR